MRGGVDLLQHAHGDLGIHLGAGELRVAQHLLNEADVGPAFEHEGRHGMAEVMLRVALNVASSRG